MDRYGRQPISAECAIASDIFDHFCTAPTLKTILGYHRNLCETLQLKPTRLPDFYPKLKAKLAKSWKAQALFKKFDARAAHKCYQRGEATPHTKVLIIGAGPCGLRTAIDAQLLGAKVVVVEKRDRMSRNNVLHLWPFVIQDLRALGAKKFFGKFCAGAIDHISIRQLQCILLKVALCLGVEIHESVGFEELVEPNEGMGWRARVTPEDHPVSQYEFDVLIGADGKRNTLEGFKRKEFRGKLAIAITANFINKRSEAEAKVEEISGVAFIFNQKFFKDLYATTGIDLENIVYYKDDTHYFVMTAKKHSLIDKGVIIQDFPDTAKLLHLENVDNDALKQYAREAAEFSTEYQMPNMEFAVNHYGKPDVAMFDFTSMYAAENASRVLQRKGHRLLMCLVGDSLLEPFWPTGSGCARGFLSALDACWAIRSWGANANPLEILSQRESIYRLLGQTTPENLQRDTASYSLEPSSRYPNLNRASVLPFQVKSLYDTDDPSVLEILPATIIPETVDVPKKRKRRDTQIHPETLLHWINFQIASCDLQIESLSHILENGLILCAVLHRYRPDLINYADRLDKNPEENNKLAVHIMDQELGVPGTLFMNGDKPDMASLLIYLTQVYYTFRGEIPHIKHPKLEMPEKRNDYNAHTAFAKLAKMASEKKQMVPLIADLDLASGSVLPHSNLPHRRSRKPSTEVAQQAERMKGDAARKAKKRRSADKFGGLTVEERQKKLQEIAANRNDRQSKRRYHCQLQKQNFYKSLHMLQSNAKRDADIPFEDYSIYLYRQSAPEFGHRVKELERKLLYPDRERGIGLPVGRGPLDQDFSSRVKNIEDQFRGAAPSEKKPRDLLRAIGKIESSDWNVKEIEKKILESKKAPEQSLQKERVPKWSKEQFLARKHKMASKGLERQDSSGGKFKEIDNTLRHVEKQLKEPALLALSKNSNKVASIAGNFSKDTKEEDVSDKKNGSSSNKPAASTMFANRENSELCHYCNKRVYLMERLCVEGLSFHRRCLRCTHCGTTLRIGACAFDKDGKVYCTQHVGLPGKTIPKKKEKTPIKPEDKFRTPDKPKTRLTDVTGLDILDRGQTPERIEYENLAVESDEERSLSPMDEEEWTDRNFGASAAENHSSDERASDSDLSSENDDEEEYSEALDNLDTIEGVQNYFKVYSEWTKKYGRSHKSPGDQNYESSSDEFYHEYSTDDDDSDDSDTQTEGEEEVRARELRRREVPANRPPPNKYTDTEVSGVPQESSVDKDSQLNRDNEIENKDNNDPISMPPIPDIILNSNESPLATKFERIKSKINSYGTKNEEDNTHLNGNAESIYEPRKNVILSQNKLGTNQGSHNDNDNTSDSSYHSLPRKNKYLVKNRKERTVVLNYDDDELPSAKSSTENNVQNKDELKENIDVSSLNVDNAQLNISQDIIDKILVEDSQLPLKDEPLLQNENKLEVSASIVNSDVNPAECLPDKDISNKQELSFDDILEDNSKLSIETVPSLVENVNDEKIDIKVDDIPEIPFKETDALAGVNLRVNSFNETDLSKQRVSDTYDDLFDQLLEEEVVNEDVFYEDILKDNIKAIDTQNFSDTVNVIKSQITAPKVSVQKNTQDLSKYFPEAKPKPVKSGPLKASKSIKEVDLSKYFGKKVDSPVLVKKLNDQENCDINAPLHSPLFGKKEQVNISPKTLKKTTPTFLTKNNSMDSINLEDGAKLTSSEIFEKNCSSVEINIDGVKKNDGKVEDIYAEVNKKLPDVSKIPVEPNIESISKKPDNFKKSPSGKAVKVVPKEIISPKLELQIKSPVKPARKKSGSTPESPASERSFKIQTDPGTPLKPTRTRKAAVVDIRNESDMPPKPIRQRSVTQTVNSAAVQEAKELSQKPHKANTLKPNKNQVKPGDKIKDTKPEKKDSKECIIS